MARDMAQRFNHLYGDTFALPEAVVEGLPTKEVVQSMLKEIRRLGDEPNAKAKAKASGTNVFMDGTVYPW